MSHNNSCELDIPYPPIEVERENKCYAQILLHDYAGPHGELTALTQYFYQYLITEHKYYEFAEDLECISISEMHHMEKLGEIIVLLGGDPLIRTIECGRCNYWCGDNILPTKNVIKFLEENIAGEKLAIRNYRKHICMIKDRKIQAVLERIILDEEEHIKIFCKYIDIFKKYSTV